jgi:phosphate transport system substrate-binding protein
MRRSVYPLAKQGRKKRMAKSRPSIRKAVTFFLAVALTVCTTRGFAGEIISGAGATFPYPIYAKWAYDYAKATDVRLNYQSIGSGGGIQQIRAKTIDFGASDAPMKPEELQESGLVQFPMIIGGVVPVVNIKGIGGTALRLDGKTLGDIFLGAIKSWNDPRIKALNPDIELPSKNITVVHRSDGSGTTWIFTNYLAAVSPYWQTRVGADKAVKWPTGLGGKGNEGVAAYVKRVDGAIGYVEYAYVSQNGLSSILLRNRDGNFVAPTSETFQAAAAGADWGGTPGMAVVLVDQPGHDSWPITGASFILVHRDQKDRGKITAVLKFFDWCYKSGAAAALELHYVPLPERVVNLVEDLWAKEILAKGGLSAVWPPK